MDKRYTTAKTYGRMEKALEKLDKAGNCEEVGCTFNSQRSLRKQLYVEVHHLFFMCECGYFSLCRDTTTKHGRTCHRDKIPTGTHLHPANWVVTRWLVSSLPETTFTTNQRRGPYSSLHTPPVD